VLKIIGLIVAGALIGLLGYAATKPDTFTVQRSIAIEASPEKIYPLIADFNNWATWSPFEKMDPSMKRTFSGAASGTGAVYAWEGNGNAGSGRMEITRAAPPDKVTIKLDFTKPFPANNVVNFTLAPSGDGTTVRWAMQGHNAYVAKLMSVFFNMDHIVGGQFEDGLAAMKAAAERAKGSKGSEHSGATSN
jgi:uncharacterized protein YndB with AHSA1/START domain